MKLDTTTDLARAQWAANRAFAEAYAPRATSPVAAADAPRPRVLVSGFGRFLTTATNATGLMVSRLLPALAYPSTDPPAAGAIDDPGRQLAVAQGVVALPGVGEVELCAMVLPVFWDLAAYLVLREAEAFVPDVVVMNGVAGPRQKLWLELGALNRANDRPDGSNALAPAEPMTALVVEAGSSELARANVASWGAVADAARAALADRAAAMADGERLDAIVHGVALAGYPRTSNSYLCNNTTYTVGYALDHPGEPITLMQSSDGDGLALTFARRDDRRFPKVPRWFMHWPGDLAGDHLDAGVAILRAALAAQVACLRAGPAPIRGDNALADIPATP